MSQPRPFAKYPGRGRVGRLALAGTLAAGALASAPAAQADTLASARSHIHRADVALKQVAATHGASRALRELEAQLSAAGQDSLKLNHRAHAADTRMRAASALGKLAGQQNRDVTVLTPLVGSLQGSHQAAIAGFVASAIQGREQALTLAARLIPGLPTAGQRQIAGVVAQVSNADAGQALRLAGAIPAGSIACGSADAVSEVVAGVVTSVQADLARVQSILPLLPADAQTQLASIADALPGQLNSLVASLKAGFSCPSTSQITGAESIGSLVGSLDQLVQSLIGTLLPSVGPGAAPTAVTIPDSVSSLLSQVVSVIPALGGGLLALGG